MSEHLVEIFGNLRDQAGKGVTFIESGNVEEFLSYKELYQQAVMVLYNLQERGLKPGDELVFQLENNKTFIICFWACILGRIIPVPLTMGHNEEHRKKLFKVWPFLNNPYLLIAAQDCEKVRQFADTSGLGEMMAGIAGKVVEEATLFNFKGEGKIAQISSGDIAFVQFSSGSTGSPKGVTLTHKNLITNVNAISRAAAYTKDDSLLSWMPLTHDMGLIGFHINPLVAGINHYIMPTTLFIRRPALWLEKASEHGVSVLCSPNFGYNYLLRNWSGEFADCNLSKVRIIYNGAEPISMSLCLEFMNTFSRFNLNTRAMRPVYGLAEASLAVSVSDLGTDIDSLRLNRYQLKTGDKIEVDNSEGGAVFVNVGKPVSHCELMIADEDGNPVGNEIVGHIQIKGDNVTRGYYNNEAATEKVTSGSGWLDTGDIGFLKNNELFITGRAKDIIFVNGLNYYPYDIESVIEEHLSIGLNKIVVTGFFNDKTQENEIAAFVFHRGDLESFAATRKAVESVIQKRLGLKVKCVLPVKSIPRTTSGKLQRFLLQEQLQNGLFDDVERSLNELVREIFLVAPAVPPQNDKERSVLRIWQQVLKLEEISCGSSFFEIGGNSLSGTMLCMQFSKELNVELPLQCLYEYQTIREQAALLDSLKKSTYRPIPVAPKADSYPLLPAQERLYYLWEMNKFSTAYNMPVVFKTTGKIDALRLQECLRDMIQRHNVLRSRFVMEKGPVMTIRGNIDFELSCLPLNGADRADDLLRTYIQPFNLNEDELFRVKLLASDDGSGYLFFDFHHIILDGVSVANLLAELFGLYWGKASPEPGIQFADFLIWQKQFSRENSGEGDKDFWQQHLSGELPLLALPGDYQRPPLFESAGGKLAFELSGSAEAGLRRMAADKGCSLHVLLLSIYRIFLSKYCGQYDTIIGIPVSGRSHPDIQQMQGMFVNNLAVRNNIHPEESFTELLNREKQIMDHALLHQGMSFNELIENIGPLSRDMSRNHVFDTMFIYQNMVFPELVSPELKLEHYFIDPGTAKYDLSLEVTDLPGGLKYYLEYSKGLFDRGTVNNMGGHFRNLIDNILEGPDTSIFGLSMLDQSSIAQYGKQEKGERKPAPADDLTIHSLFEAQVMKTPDAISMDYNGKVYTYGELNEMSNGLARQLMNKGLGAGSISAIILDRSPELIISILAILKSGGCYLPIDSELPADRINYMLSDSKCSGIFSNTRLLDNLGTAEKHGRVIINMDEPGHRHAAGINPDNMINSDSLAYIIYTSGTTGRPKGVMIEHKSLVNYIRWSAKVYVGSQVTSFALFSSISFDLTVTSIFTPLITGNKIVIYEDELCFERIFDERKSDIIKLTPSHLKLILKNGGKGLQETTNTIKKFIVGGENLEVRTVKALMGKLGNDIEVYNEYGPTEATVGCMIYKADPVEKLSDVPIGIAMENARIYILDNFLQPVASGIAGEMYIAGDCLARGYFGMEALTAQKFLPDPFNPGQKMYKTGDLAKLLANGNIAYLGRNDQQVKINGYRIEPGEIREALMNMEDVADCLVACRCNKNDQKVLVAYYVMIPSAQPPATSSMKHFLAGRLPYYMIPSFFIQLPAIPLTVNGKPNLDALPELYEEAEETQNTCPENETESISLEIWQDVLGSRKITVCDNFFDHGGDSIKAVQIVSRLREKGILLNVKDLLSYHTIRQVSVYAQQEHSAQRDRYAPATGSRRLSPIEQWFFSQSFQNSNYYCQSVLLAFNSKISIPALEESLRMMVTQYDELRLNYDRRNNELFYNNAHLENAFIVPVFAESANNIPAICEGIRRQMDIENGLLIKAAVIRIPESQELLFLTAHHLVVDGISWREMLGSLYKTYIAVINGTPVSAPAKTATIREWNEKLMEYAASEACKEEEPYWANVDQQVFGIPVDFPTGDQDWRSLHSTKVLRNLDRNETAACVRELRSKYRADMQVLLTTALACTLENWIDQDTFVIEFENHGRHLEDIDVSRTAGWFTAMYPVRIMLPEAPISAQIKSIKEQIKHVPNKGIGYGVRKYFGAAEQSLHGGMAEIRFNYLGEFDRELNNSLYSFSNLPIGRETAGENHMTAKLELNCMIISGEFNLEVIFNQKAHKASTIHHFADKFVEHIRRILAHMSEETETHFTPSDFSGVLLNQEELDLLF